MNNGARDNSRKQSMLRCSYLYAQHGLTQKEIAEQLAISQSEVSRLLGQAERDGILGRPALNVGREDLDDLERFFRESHESQAIVQKLGASFAHHLPKGFRLNFTICHGAFDKFTDSASLRVIELIRTSSRIGIMWGRTVFKVVDGIVRHSPARSLTLTQSEPTRPGRGFVEFCIPLCGDPVHLMNQNEVRYSASYLAERLANIVVAGQLDRAHCLTGVPAYVRSDLLSQEPFRQWLKSIPGYAEILDSDNPNALMRAVDTIISGVGIIAPDGSPEHETAAFIRERYMQGTETKGNLRNWVLGDIGGILIEASEAHQQMVKDLNDGWIGIKRLDLEKLALQTRTDGSPGIIVIAYQKEKAKLLNMLAKSHLINEAIISPELAEEMLRLQIAGVGS
jgi:DNA-binding transcriptional regulator LsrR (DeoR family)